jgi:hypothetical protein
VRTRPADWPARARAGFGRLDVCVDTFSEATSPPFSAVAVISKADRGTPQPSTARVRTGTNIPAYLATVLLAARRPQGANIA